MTYSTFVDTERNAALLVCDDPIYALGPVLVADSPMEAVEALEAFTANLERPADEMPTIQLMTEWTGFLSALHGMVMDDKGELVQPNGDPQDRLPADPRDPGGESGQAPVGPPGGAEDYAGAGGGETVAETPAAPQGAPETATAATDEGEDDGEDLDLADRLAHVPGGTPAQRGEMDCWNCGGSGEVQLGDGTADCGVCGGSGRLKASA